MPGRVAWITVAPVKGLALQSLDEAVLERTGVAADRRFYLVDEDDRLLNGKRLGRLVCVRARFDESTGMLELTLPGNETVAGIVDTGEAVETDFYGRPVTGDVVVGPWSEALSEWGRMRIRVVQPHRPGTATDRGRGVSLVSTTALEELARAGGAGSVDGRRFRMLFGVDGIGAHEEDSWIGRRVRIGEAVARLHGNVGRCAVTTQNPDTGIPDFDTLRTLARYRGEVTTTEPLPFGVWGEVDERGVVRLGDPVGPA